MEDGDVAKTFFFRFLNDFASSRCPSKAKLSLDGHRAAPQAVFWPFWAFLAFPGVTLGPQEGEVLPQRRLAAPRKRGGVPYPPPPDAQFGPQGEGPGRGTREGDQDPHTPSDPQGVGG